MLMWLVLISGNINEYVDSLIEGDGVSVWYEQARCRYSISHIGISFGFGDFSKFYDCWVLEAGLFGKCILSVLYFSSSSSYGDLGV